VEVKLYIVQKNCDLYSNVLAPIVTRGSGGALKLPQRVQAEPRRQTHSDAF